MNNDDILDDACSKFSSMESLNKPSKIDFQ